MQEKNKAGKNSSPPNTEVWKVAIQTQMHFNELLIRSRATVITVALAAIGATAIGLKDSRVYLTLCGHNIHIAVIIVILGVLFLTCQFIIDYFYYRNLLLGAVAFTERLDEKHPECFGLTRDITACVSKTRASVILLIYYLLPIAMGLFLAYLIHCSMKAGAPAFTPDGVIR
jgi:hypothetical protein